MTLEMYPRTPFVGALLRCSGCDREVEVEGKHDEIKI